VTSGLFDGVPLDKIAGAEAAVRQAVVTQLPEQTRHMRSGKPLSEEDREALLEVSRRAVAEWNESG
jgi:gluconate kinase